MDQGNENVTIQSSTLSNSTSVSPSPKFAFPSHIHRQQSCVLSPARTSSTYTTTPQHIWTPLSSSSRHPRAISVTLKCIVGMNNDCTLFVGDECLSQLLVGFGNVSLKRSVQSFGKGSETKITFPYRSEECVRYGVAIPF